MTPFLIVRQVGVRVSATSAPFSPVMIVMRSLNGVSQFTVWLAIVPLLSVPTASTMSSCGAAAAVRGAGVDAHVGLLGDPGRQVDVVRRQVLDDADVGDAARERALAPGGDLIDLADQPVLDALPRALQGGVEALDVADAADELLGGEQVAQLGRLGRGRCDRLLDQGVDAALGERAPELQVVDGRRGDHDVVDAHVEELLEVAVDRLALDHVGRRRRRVVDALEVDAVEAR